jgi:hypothetical protein
MSINGDTSMMRFARFAALLAAFPLAAACSQEIAAAGHEPAVVRMGNSGPFAGRSDGLGFDTDNYGAGLVQNGDIEQMFNSSRYVSVEADFLGLTIIPDIDTADADQGVWSGDDTATAGCPVVKDDADNGQMEMLLDNGSEVGDCDFNFGNYLSIDSDTEPFCIFRLTAAVAPAAADTLSWGFYAAQADTLAGFNTFAGFSVAGADLNLDAQSDDATTDVNATDTGVDIVAGAANMYEYLISMNSMHGRTSTDRDGASPTDVHFFYRTSSSSAFTQLLPGTTFSVGADLAMQPYVHIEKTSGTTVPDLIVDYVRCAWQRE